MIEPSTLVGWRVAVSSLVLALLAVAGLVEPAAAQPTATFADLAGRLSAGDRIKVEEASGRKLDGRVLQVTPAGLTLERGGDQVTLREPDVRMVWKVGRRIGRAAEIGFFVGAATGALIGGIAAGGQQGDAGDVLMAALIMGGGFAALHVGLEAAHPSRRTAVYRAPAGHARLTLQPVLARGSRGLALTFAF